MESKEFLDTIYLGDRACVSIFIDSVKDEVKIGVDEISRVRSDKWNYYTDEDLEGGFIVFARVKSIYFDPPGFIPNDMIGKFDVIEGDNGDFIFTIEIASFISLGKYEIVSVIIHAQQVCLEANDGRRIFD